MRDYERDRERDLIWRNFCEVCPIIPFRPHWNVVLVPPFAGAAIRFYVLLQKSKVSVYLDIEDNLGSVGQPYWELYPNTEGETSRFLLNEVEELCAEIDKALEAEVI